MPFSTRRDGALHRLTTRCRSRLQKTNPVCDADVKRCGIPEKPRRAPVFKNEFAEMPSEITGTDDDSMATLRMIGVGNSFVRSLAVLALLEILRAQHSGAQTVQTLPEVDAYVKVNPSFRFNFQAKETREGGDPTQAEIGPSLDFYIKPLVRLQNPTEFELDDSKSRFTVISIGYRYMPQANGCKQ